MLIQVHGAGFDNRGAQLMLWTVIDRLQSINPEARFAVEASRSTFQQRAAYGLRTLAPKVGDRSPRKAIKLLPVYDHASRLLPSTLESNYGLVRRCDVDAFIDISGYAFGDKWRLIFMQAVHARMKRYARRGKPTVLLPQMFGPFEEPDKRRAFQAILKTADLIYARDKPSLAAVNEINDSGKTIGLAPDITIFSKPLDAPRPGDGRYACLVPNMRMRDKAGETWGETYVDAMARAGATLAEAGIEPHIVIHDGGKEDIVIGREIADKLGLAPDRIYHEDDPRRIKGFLAGAEMTVGSRFHALVSSLSVGTPVIAIGWAHKYEALLEDFGVPNFYCTHEQGPDGVASSVEQLANPAHNAEVSGVIRERKQAMQADSDRMWNEVAERLGLTRA